MKKAILAATLAGFAMTSAPVLADPPSWAPAHGRRAHEQQQRLYDAQGRYAQPRALSRNDQVWRGNDGHYYCRRENGTTGLVLGLAVGGVLGSQLAGRGDRTLGAILGAAGGGLLGSQIDRGQVRCR